MDPRSLLVGAVAAMSTLSAQAGTAPGPLRVCARNPRYFADPSGSPVYLTGSHTWASLYERAYDDTPAFDYKAYLEFMAGHGHNFMRLWAWEHTAWMQFTPRMIRYHPHPFRRTGPGKALDGRAKFDLTQFNERFFQRLRSRVAAAGDRGIYVAVMLFQGFSIEQKGTRGVDPKKGNPWDGHPFNARNNINGIDGDRNGNGEGEETHTLASPAVTRIQEAYVRKVVDTVNGLDNVLYEIANESHGRSAAWQRHMIDFIHACERAKPRQHPVGMTFPWGGKASGTNADLFASPAEWVSPNAKGGYKDDPPPADGRKVVLSDTDHLWGIGGNAVWVWKSLLRGHNPIFMDPYLDARTGGKLDRKYDPIRRAMGHSLALARRIGLAATTPQPRLASTRYCLAAPGAEYLVYLPKGGTVTLDLSGAKGTFQAEWVEPDTGKARPGSSREGGSRRRFTAPFAGHAVLHVRRVP